LSLPAPASLTAVAKPLEEFGEAVGIPVGTWREREDFDEITAPPEFEITVEQARAATGKVLALIAAYGLALEASLRSVDESLHLVPDLRRDQLETFLAQQSEALPLKLDLTLKKAVLVREYFGPAANIRPTLFFYLSTLEKLLSAPLSTIEAWWDEDRPQKLAVLVPDPGLCLDGRYLAVVGGDSTGAFEEDWKRVTAVQRGAEPSQPGAAPAPSELFAAARLQLKWLKVPLQHLTPLHLAVKGPAPPDDPVARRLWIHLLNLCLQFTADTTLPASGNGALTATYQSARQQVTVELERPDRPLPETAPKAASALVSLVEWAYAPPFCGDRLSFIQSTVANALQGIEPKDRYDELVKRAPGFEGEIQTYWRLFMEGKVEEFAGKVQALEELVADTVRAFSERTAALIKSLSDAMLAAVGVVLGSFVAELFKKGPESEILVVGVLLYLAYLLVFPLIYGMSERWWSYRALVRQFEDRRRRFVERLYEGKVKTIVGKHVDKSRGRFRRWFWTTSATYVLVAAALAWLVLVPSPVAPVAYEPPLKRALSGPWTPNEALRAMTPIAQGRLSGGEAVAVDAAGRLYTGTADGLIVRVTRGAGAPDVVETFARTGGRPLGLKFDAAGNLVVADGVKGLLSVDPAGRVESLATEAENLPFGFTDDLAIGRDGTIYFSDASSRFGPDRYLYDLLEGRPHGRLLAYDPARRQTRVLLDDLYFANGVALARDESFVLVNETYRYRIRRLWLTGEKAQQAELLIDNLPGFPDNLTADGEGHLWLALFTVRNDLMDWLSPHPFLKEQLAKLPRSLWPKPAPYGLVAELDEQGRVLRSLHDPGGERANHVTSALAHGGHLYLGSVDGDAIGVLPIPPP
jgi:sugar lactone lactonase YvrE